MPAPIYERIADALRRQIDTGDIQPGEQLPTITALAEQWNVSLAPARQALALLATEGLIVTHRGTAATVAEQPGLIRLAPHRYRPESGAATYQQEAQRAHVTIEVSHDTTVVTATPELAERLGISSDQQLTQTDYLFTVSGRPVGMSRCWEPLDLTGGTDIEDPEEGPYAALGIIDRFAHIGQHVTTVEEALTFRPPTDGELLRLSLPPAMWVISIAQAWHAEERTVCVADVVHRPDAYRAFVYRLPVLSASDD